MSHVWVINDKGGTGKTSVATVLTDHLLSTDQPIQVLDCDARAEDAGKKRSLSAIFPAAQRIEISVSPEALQEKPSLAISHWDSLFERAKLGPTLADFGANVAGSLLYWLDESDIGARLAATGSSIDFVVVTTANPTAVADALTVVERLRAAAPTACRRIFVALNQYSGPFDAYADSAELAAFGRLVEAGELTLVVVPKCSSEIWLDAERLRITALKAAAMPAAELQALLATPELETARGRKALARWHKAVVEACMDAGLLSDDRDRP
jgi:MinD-like ATPase involved in chromosome partitioning or flagellar assembly